MDNQENEISLSQLFAVVKKSLIRGLIYVLVAVIFATAVLVLVRTFTSTHVYNATISFSTAETTTLSSLSANKANVVNKALKADGKGLDVSDEVVRNLTVSAVIPEDNEKDSSFIPTSFTVSLKNSSELKFSSGEYKSLVDNIAKEFVNQFATSSMPELSDNIIDVNSQLANEVEYLQIAYYLSDMIDDYLSNLNTFAASNSVAATFADVNGKTLNGVISDMTFLKSNIDNIKSTIATNKSGFGKLNVYLETAKTLTDAEVEKYNTINEDAKARLAAYNTTVQQITQNENGNNIYMFDDSVFVLLTEQAATASKQYAEAVKRQREITSLKTTVGDETGTQDENIANLLKSYTSTLSSSITSYKTLAKEFNNNKTLISPATVSNPANAVAESFITMKVIIITDIAVALIAYIFAFSKTFAVMKKKGEI